MSTATAIILYPRTPTSTFNKEYYLSTHMPLAAKHWTKHGLKSYAVTELNADGPYSYSVVVEWETPASFANALQDPGTKEIMDDVKNFSTEAPVIAHGPVIGSG